MPLQYIHDQKGNTTGVFIPIEEWEMLKNKYSGLRNEESENVQELAAWQKEILDKRLADYYKDSSQVSDFDQTLDEIEKGL